MRDWIQSATKCEVLNNLNKINSFFDVRIYVRENRST